MRKLALLLTAVVLSASCCSRSETTSGLALVPYPDRVELRSGEYLLPAEPTLACADSVLLPVAGFIERSLPDTRLSAAACGVQGDIVIALDPSIDTIGGYRLAVSPRGVRIDAGSYGGAVAAVATLRQLMPAGGSRAIPAVDIADAPRFAWRGFMLDVARHFYTKDEVLALLDKMAQYKFNKFHWHLTDDQGWRIEIRRYPELTERGAWRDPSTHNHDIVCAERAAANDDETYLLPESKMRTVGGRRMYGGYYTQDEIREVVAYAAALGIDVIPEVDMPGHSLQVVGCYPGLSCTGRAEWGETFSTPLCLGNDATIEFCKNVYAEIFELFPYPYAHLGADEVEKTNWTNCPKCRGRRAAHGLADEHELHGWFVGEMREFFSQNGRRLIGWDEIVGEGMSQQPVVEWWRNWVPENLLAAADNGNDIIVSTGEYLYLDGSQNRNTLRKVYGFDVSQLLSDEQMTHVLGIHTNLWCEYVASFELACAHIFPRLFAVSEMAWSRRTERSYDEFVPRAYAQLQRLDAEGWNYRIPDLGGFCDRNVFTDTTEVTVTVPFGGIEVRYTTDGSTPGRESALYTGPIAITDDCTLRLRAYTASGYAGETVSAEYRKMDFAEPTVCDDAAGGLSVNWYDYRGESCAEIDSAPFNGSYVTDGVYIPEGVSGNIGLVFTGYFDAPADGIYSFYTFSDDGSVMVVDGIEVVGNDGPHPREERSGQIALRRGLHPVEVRYFDSNGGILEAGTIDETGVRTPFGKSAFKH